MNNNNGNNRDFHYDDDGVETLRTQDEQSYAPTNSGQPNQMANVNEEMGADFAYGAPIAGAGINEAHTERSEDRVETESGGAVLGWTALVFGIASWFIWPVFIGITAAVLGYLAYRQGARGLGGWAMAAGLIAVALNMIIVPFYYAIT